MVNFPLFLNFKILKDLIIILLNVGCLLVLESPEILVLVTTLLQWRTEEAINGEQDQDSNVDHPLQDPESMIGHLLGEIMSIQSESNDAGFLN